MTPLLPAPSPPRPALNAKQIARMGFRIGLFRRRGLDERTAEAWACRLATRDLDRDDRYLCIECSNLQRGGTCFASTKTHRLYPLPLILQRCEAFRFQTP